MATHTPKRKPGRPPGSPNKKPKAPKAPGRIGRPSVWPDELQPAICRFSHTIPALLDEAVSDPDFKKKFSDLLLDFHRGK